MIFFKNQNSSENDNINNDGNNSNIKNKNDEGVPVTFEEDNDDTFEVKEHNEESGDDETIGMIEDVHFKK